MPKVLKQKKIILYLTPVQLEPPRTPPLLEKSFKSNFEQKEVAKEQRFLPGEPGVLTFLDLSPRD